MAEVDESEEPREAAEFELRSLAVDVFLPQAMMAIGQGATAPMIALVAIDLGASVATAGLVVGLFGFGAFLGSVPGGLLASRLGDRSLMAVATSMMTAACMLILTQPSLVVFGLLVLVMGAATSMFAVGRLAHATELTPLSKRGRVMSTVGGTNRMGLFIGPLLGGLTIGPMGLTGPFLINGVFALVAALSVFAGRPSSSSRPDREASPPLLTIIRDHRTTFATAAMAIVLLQVVRGSRQALIPLWGSHIGLDARQVGILFSVSAGMEILMFYPVGRVMDLRGRKSTSIPAMTLLSLGVATIPLTSDLLTLSLSVALVGFANGMGTGINQTLSSDLSPDRGRTVFLGLWRTITDGGTAAGPALVAIVASIASLSLAAVVISGIGFGGAVVMWRLVPETLKKERV